MEIKWPNVVAFALAILSIVLAVWHRQALRAAVTGIGHIGPGHSMEDKTLGLWVLGVILVSLVAIVRLVISSNRSNDV